MHIFPFIVSMFYPYLQSSVSGNNRNFIMSIYYLLKAENPYRVKQWGIWKKKKKSSFTIIGNK